MKFWEMNLYQMMEVEKVMGVEKVVEKIVHVPVEKIMEAPVREEVVRENRERKSCEKAVGER